MSILSSVCFGGGGGGGRGAPSKDFEKRFLQHLKVRKTIHAR